jgi:predicted RNase H-like HicB family nuclease
MVGLGRDGCSVWWGGGGEEVAWAIEGYQERDKIMVRYYTLEYWIDEGWYVGRLREVPGVFSQGVSLQELEENIRDAYQWGVGYECCNSRSDEQR